MIWVRLISERGLDIAELKSRIEPLRPLGEAGCQFGRFLGDIITIESIEPDVPIAVLGQTRLPPFPGRRQGIWCERLGDYDLGPVPVPVAMQQNVLLGSFHIHLEKIDLRRRISVTKL